MNIIKFSIITILSFLWINSINSQNTRWQQRVHYDIHADFNVDQHQYKGKIALDYTNNSPDTLMNVFYHLYFNAFQPGSMMDVRSRTIMDPDKRVGDRIEGLSAEEIGFIKVNSLLMNGKAVSYQEVGTILEVQLVEPILPLSTVQFDIDYLAQVPVQIRRSGRNNAEGIDYSMTQWYPKLCEYDDQGWHANPYIGREFYGIWGDYDVKITMPSKYIIGGTGVLQNADEIGYGYSNKDIKHSSDKNLTWHFKADNVHDFAFAADPDYKHTQITSDNGTILHFLYQENEETASWGQLPVIMKEALAYMNHRYGVYAYPCYTFIQGGDGGMEYPMATLIRGRRSIESLVGVSLHEWMHSWYQMMLATNESLYSWMDEGFTSFAETEVAEYLKEKKVFGEKTGDFPWARTYDGYRRYIMSPYAESANTHSDHCHTNYAFGINSYYTGNIFLKQLEYIMGEDALTRTIKQYYNEWKFKHPRPNDFLRIAERNGGLELDWYLENWINTTKTINYGVDTLIENGKNTTIVLSKIGKHPMPIDIKVTYTDGKSESFNIPLRIMRGNKPLINGEKLLEDWPWTYPTYSFDVTKKMSKIESIQIDPSSRLADVDMSNNIWPEIVEVPTEEEKGK